MSSTREKRSRAREFGLLFGYSPQPDDLYKHIIANPSGSIHEVLGLEIQFGKVGSLIPYLDPADRIAPFRIDPEFVCHLDNVSADRKRVLERLYGAPSGSLAGARVRADVFIAARDGQKFYISVKDDSSASKLGQVSKATQYGAGRLEGGLSTVPDISDRVPDKILWTDTGLTESKYRNLKSGRDREFAYFKSMFESEWQQICKKSIDDARRQARSFSEELSTDRDTFLAFFSEVLAGSMLGSKDFYVLIGDKPVNFGMVFNRLKNSSFSIHIEDHNPGNLSFIIWLKVNGKKYGITKIEPSFDGREPNVSQTKGIIYYFQQWPNSGTTYKDLLIDLSK